jgi:hypothetical protein
MKKKLNRDLISKSAENGKHLKVSRGNLKVNLLFLIAQQDATLYGAKNENKIYAGEKSFDKLEKP